MKERESCWPHVCKTVASSFPSWLSEISVLIIRARVFSRCSPLVLRSNNTELMCKRLQHRRNCYKNYIHVNFISWGWISVISCFKVVHGGKLTPITVDGVLPCRPFPTCRNYFYFFVTSSSASVQLCRAGRAACSRQMNWIVSWLLGGQFWSPGLMFDTPGSQFGPV